MNYDLEFENMGRNAATILHSNFEFRLQRFIEENLVSKYKDKIGKTVSDSQVSSIMLSYELVKELKNKVNGK